MLVNGKWTADWHPVQAKDGEGRFVRQQSSFRNWITADGAPGPTGKGGFKAEAGRYRLYVALICPWASRTLIARKLKGLEDLIPVTVVNPVLTAQGWGFGGYRGAGADPLHKASHLHQLYTHADDDYTGRATVPVLWDEQTDTMVSNESADIVQMFNTAFAGLVPGKPDLYPADLAADIDEAVAGVFQMLDQLEDRLTGDYLFDDRFTEADIRLFVTLIRFDAAYHGLFKTNLRRISDYPRLSAYMARVLRLPGVRDTVNLDHIKAGYYSIKALNPSGIVPAGPDHVITLLESVK